MARIVPVTNEERDALTKKKSFGQVAWPIIKQFLESDLDMARIETERNPDTLVATLRMNVKKYNHPCKVSCRRGEIFLVRVDLSKNDPAQISELTPEVVDERI